MAATSSSAVTASSFPLSTLPPLILPFFPVPAESSNFKGTTFELVCSAFLCLFIFLSLMFGFFFFLLNQGNKKLVGGFLSLLIWPEETIS
ncbi:hypothetical protein PanWU01x14_018720 [Parasponia andersonii]|uniref:Transmembrane protein n=1 Tax=Parasponia andersonii TaxID=3476 RepID=A0A2P5DZ91_PARAD|nr:hypothetical protein PanWU01x14_018720 [Parasponia andersonii]